LPRTGKRVSCMIFMIDNYDSFTYNLVQYFQEMGNKVLVRRNDAVSTKEIERARPDYLIISPGPGVPQNAGISVEAVRTLAGRLPILGVCLGHQAIGFAFGARIDSAARLMHGDGEIMGVRHKRLAIEGVQFHPESILTTSGKTLLKNFLEAYAPR